VTAGTSTGRIVIAYGVALLTIVALDALWLGVLAHDIYRAALGPLLAERPNLGAAAAFYLLYPVGLMVFVIGPQLGERASVPNIARGALFGFIAYATYDLTNLATLRDFPAGIALLDMIWGAVISADATGAALIAARLVARG
jgi:uncharacterized membrane protein